MENIKLIAEFDGWKQSESNEYLFYRYGKRVKLSSPEGKTLEINLEKIADTTVDKFGKRLRSLPYNSSYDWLIPVIRKCMKLSIEKDYFPLKHAFYKIDTEVTNYHIESLFEEVVNFIKIYNEKFGEKV
jgi:hypothetical protein